MADNKIMVFKCANPECGGPLKIPRPPKSGKYTVTCPHCGARKNYILKGLDAFGVPPQPAVNPETNANQEKPEPPKQPDIQDKPEPPKVVDNSAKPPIMLHDDFLVNELYTFKCPHCKEEEIGLKSTKVGHKKFPCPRCRGIIEADVRSKTEVVDLSGGVTASVVKGKLVLLRRGWLNKDYPLAEGSHTVGRHDDAEMSDISIKNDPGMSRRSIRIDVGLTSQGYTFKLTVLKATNPVLHNGKPLMKGEAVSLNFGDSIVMGKTKFRFDKDA